MEYTYRFIGKTKFIKKASQHSGELIGPTLNDWTASTPGDKTATLADAKRISQEDLEVHKNLCARLISEKSAEGFADAKGIFKINNKTQFKVGIHCDKNKIYSYYHEDGKELVSFTHDNFDAAVDDFLSHIY